MGSTGQGRRRGRSVFQENAVFNGPIQNLKSLKVAVRPADIRRSARESEITPPQPHLSKKQSGFDSVPR
jgi:hypothetical protein